MHVIYWPVEQALQALVVVSVNLLITVATCAVVGVLAEGPSPCKKSVAANSSGAAKFSAISATLPRTSTLAFRSCSDVG